MKCSLLLAISLLIFNAQGAVMLVSSPAPLSTQRASPPPANRATSRIVVTVPHEKAELIVEGRTIAGSGLSRTFETPPLTADRTYRYVVVARWRPNGYTTLTRRRMIPFRAGDRVLVDLATDDPSDRVRVEYVPTPPDVVDEMIKLAGIRASDVVYEPGCGDARITIAAVQGGASRGVGIDIDPKRVAEARTHVKVAGLENTIDIRLGDALDIQDLSSASVVFLYMGEQFNLLIRPTLWRELKVGARVVSHGFSMGDWKPDQSLKLKSAYYGDYELYLWTVTEELKRSVQ